MIHPVTPDPHHQGLSHVGEVIRTIDLSPKTIAAGDVIAQLGHDNPGVRQRAHVALQAMYPGYVDDLITGELGSYPGRTD